jgi:hypothetical protein
MATLHSHWQNFRVYLRDFELPILRDSVRAGFGEYFSLASWKKDVKAILVGWVSAAVIFRYTDVKEEFWWYVVLGPATLGFLAIASSLWRLWKAPYSLLKMEKERVSIGDIVGKALAEKEFIEAQLPAFAAAQERLQAEARKLMDNLKGYSNPDVEKQSAFVRRVFDAYKSAVGDIKKFSVTFDKPWPTEEPRSNPPPDTTGMPERLRQSLVAADYNYQRDSHQLRLFIRELDFDRRLRDAKNVIADIAKRSLNGR